MLNAETCQCYIQSCYAAAAMNKEIVSFNVKLLAGLTQMDSRNPHVVDRPNGMDGWILNRTAEGVGRIRIGPQASPQYLLASPGDMILFPPRAPHHYSYEAEAGHWAHHWIYFFPERTG